MLVRSFEMNDIHHGMADYYTIIAKAVGGLDPNTGAARRRLYDRARVALVAEMRSARNALDKSDIVAAQRSLEEAIGQIEADAEPDEPTAEAADAPLTYLPRGRVVEVPYPPANQNGKHHGQSAQADSGPRSFAAPATTRTAMGRSRGAARRCCAISPTRGIPDQAATPGSPTSWPAPPARRMTRTTATSLHPGR